MAHFRRLGCGRQFFPWGDSKETPGPQSGATACWANKQHPFPPHSTPPSEWRPAQPLSDQATAPGPVRSPPGVARPISPPGTPPPVPPLPSRLRRGGARGCMGRILWRDYKSQQPQGSRPLGGATQSSELGGALALRLGNACNQSPGGSRRVLIGAGRSPQGPGQKPDP